MTARTVTGRLAEQHATLGNHDIPVDVRTAARHSILDWLGCALAGQREPLSTILREEVVDEHHPGPATVIGHSTRQPMLTAVLLNGAAGHALDFDDTNLTMHGHPTAPVLPAVLALSESNGSSGADLIGSLVVGTEVAVRVASILGASHYQRGWHTTGTAGVFGAAAACSWLLGLDPGRSAVALAIAGSQAGGLKASFGTMTKPLHAGRAAADGLLAARLAARGYTGNPAILEDAQGLGNASLASALDPAIELHAGRWFTSETLFKFHAACYGTHATMNAALRLRSQIENPADIDRVTVTVAPELMNVCAIPEPSTGLEGKFSLRAATALTLLGENTADLRQYSDERMTAPDLVDMRNRVTVETAAGRGGAVADVRILTTDGRVLEASADSSLPIGDLDGQWVRLTSKFFGLVQPLLGADKTRELIAAVERLDASESPGELLALTRGSGARVGAE